MTTRGELDIAKRYIPTKEAIKFIAFIRATGNEENTSPEAHYRIADALFSGREEDQYVLIECLRGMGKSTVLEYAVIYIAALGYWPGFGKVPFMVFLGANQDGNVKAFFKNLDSKVKNSVFLSKLITIPKQIDNEIEFVNADGVEMIVAGRGMNVNWRGIRSKSGHRPSAILADDVLSNEVMTSATVRNTVDTNWFNSALPALVPRHKVIYVGTPLCEDDLLHKLKNSGEYFLVRIPLCSNFPCSEEDFDSVWPDRFDYKYASKLFRQYKSAGKTQSFYTEFMLNVTDLTTLLVSKEEINWFDPTALKKNRHLYNIYIVTDFANSTKKSADFSTIGVFAVSNNGDWLLTDGQCKRQDMQRNLEDLFDYVKEWNPIAVGIETSGQQGGFIPVLEEMMLTRGTWFSFGRKPGSKDKGIRPARDKVTRFVTGVQPKFNQGKVHFPKPEITIKTNPRLYELIEEMENELGKLTMAGGVEALKHDDCLTGDTLVTMADLSTKCIKDVAIGDKVMTFDVDFLPQLVEDVIATGTKEVMTYAFSDGTELNMTSNHPVLTTMGYIPAELLTEDDEVIKCNSIKIASTVRELKLNTTTGLPNTTGDVGSRQHKQMLLERVKSLTSDVDVRSTGAVVKQDVPKNVVTVSLLGRKDRRQSLTYNLEVKEVHNFIANGVVVHNCIDLLNQLSEMEVFLPSTEVTIESSDLNEGRRSDIWIGGLGDDIDDFGGSTVF